MGDVPQPQLSKEKGTGSDDQQSAKKSKREKQVRTSQRRMRSDDNLSRTMNVRSFRFSSVLTHSATGSEWWLRPSSCLGARGLASVCSRLGVLDHGADIFNAPDGNTWQQLNRLRKTSRLDACPPGRASNWENTATSQELGQPHESFSGQTLIIL
jgi:hypothetical protein